MHVDLVEAAGNANSPPSLRFEALTLADRIAVMNKGVLQQFDTPERIYDDPASLFVAGFIGSPPMNFIDANCKV